MGLITEMLPEPTIYEDIAAELYDIRKGENPIPGEFEFYLAELATLPEPHLEIGCGTGRILLRLLQAGLEVEGLDLSGDMLRICCRKAASLNLTPVLYQQRMQEMSVANSYGAIIAPLGTLMLLEDEAELGAALSAFHRHMRPSGRLMFSVWKRPRELATTGWRPVRELETPLGPVRMSQAIEVLPDGETVLERYRFDDLRPCGGLLGVHRERMRFWTALAMSTQLLKAGFETVDVTGDYLGAQLEDSPILVFTAIRN